MNNNINNIRLNDPEHRLGTDTPIEKTQKDKRRKFFYSILSVIALVSIVYISGIYQYLFFFTTPPTVRQQKIESSVPSEAELSIPVTLFIFQNDTLGSERSAGNLERLVGNASNIWAQANINLAIKNIYTPTVSTDDLEILHYKPGEFVRKLQGFDNESINVFLIRNLGGLNGVSFGGLRAVAIADKTSVFDFRALAHEIGHQLGLNHVDDHEHLMSEGANSVKLEPGEIETARGFAQTFFIKSRGFTPAAPL